MQFQSGCCARLRAVCGHGGYCTIVGVLKMARFIRQTDDGARARLTWGRQRRQVGQLGAKKRGADDSASRYQVTRRVRMSSIPAGGCRLVSGAQNRADCHNNKANHADNAHDEHDVVQV